MEIGLLSALIALICLVISLAYRVDYLNDRLTTRLASQERAVSAALAALQGLSEGKVLREAARRYESRSEQARIREIARTRGETAPPVPSLWLIALAEEMEAVPNCDGSGHEHNFSGQCLIFGGDS